MRKLMICNKIFRSDQYNKWKRGAREQGEVKYVNLGVLGGWVKEDVSVNVNSMCVENLRKKTQMNRIGSITF